MPKGEGGGFAALIEQAQQGTDPSRQMRPDLSSPFPIQLPTDHRVIDTEDMPKIKGIVEYDYQAHVRFFSIPHDQDAYEEVLNQILAGEGILRYEDRTFSKEGDFLVTICYLTKKPQKKKADPIGPPRGYEDDDD